MKNLKFLKFLVGGSRSQGFRKYLISSRKKSPRCSLAGDGNVCGRNGGDLRLRFLVLLDPHKLDLLGLRERRVGCLKVAT